MLIDAPKILSQISNDQFRVDLQKKKKERSAPELPHLCDHFWPENATEIDATQVLTLFFFFLETTAKCGLILTTKYKFIAARLSAM